MIKVTYKFLLCFLQELELCGSAEAPQVLLDTQGEMYFKPTYIGAASYRSYAIKNVSRIPLRSVF